MIIYLSHKISGGKEANISYVEKKRNCQKAVLIANVLRATFPSVEFYVPGGPTEQFVHRAFIGKYLTVKQILEIDCKIIDDCEAMLVYVPDGDELQGGRMIEYDHASLSCKPTCIFAEIDEVIKWLTHFLLRV